MWFKSYNIFNGTKKLKIFPINNNNFLLINKTIKFKINKN